MSFDESFGTGVNRPRQNRFNASVLGDTFQADRGMYDDMTSRAYSQATRTLDPTFDRMRQQFDQRAVNQGLASGSEAYNTAFDQYMRQRNDAYNQAAFGAMEYGANRLDADRAAHEQARQFNAGLSEQGRQFDNTNASNLYGIDVGALTSRYNANQQADAQRYAANAGLQGTRYVADLNRLTDMDTLGEQGRQFDRSFGLQELLGIEGIADSYRDDAARDFLINNNVDQQQFNNRLAVLGLAPGVNPSGYNAGNAFDTALTGSIYNQNRDDRMYQGGAQAFTDIMTNVPWGQIWGNDTSQQPTGATGFAQV